MRSKNILFVILACMLLTAGFLFSGCEGVFTSSPLTGFQASPDSMTSAQKTTYAQQALAGGNTANMKKALAALLADPNTKNSPLVAQLAAQTSGIATLMTNSIQALSSGSLTANQITSITNQMATINQTDAQAAAVVIQANPSAVDATTKLQIAAALLSGSITASGQNINNYTPPAPGVDANYDTAKAIFLSAQADIQADPSNPMNSLMTSLQTQLHF